MFGVGGGGGVCRVGSRFGMLGAFVGKFPRTSILLAIGVAVLSIFPYFFSFRADFTLSEGFIAADAPSHREVAVQRKFFGKEDSITGLEVQNEQWYMALFGIARAENGNMLASAEFAEFDTFYGNVTTRMNFSVDGVTFRYSDICQPLCDINGQLQKLMENSWLATMRYPVSQVLNFDVNIGKHVFNRTYDSRTGELTGARFLAYYFTVFLDNDLRRRQVEQFEIVVAQLAKEHNTRNGTRVEILTHGSHGVTGEIQRGVRDWLHSLAYGVGVAAATALAISWLGGWYSDEQYTWRRVTLAFASLALGVAALASALGYTLLAGGVVNLLFVTSPTFTFVFLINLHGAFVIADAWSRLCGEAHRKQFTASERLAATFEQVAASYLLSNSIVFVGFLAAHFLTITNYGAYTLYLAFVILLNFFYQAFCYSALLVLLCYPSERRSESVGSATLFYAPAASAPPPLAAAADDGGATKPPAPIIKPTPSTVAAVGNAFTTTVTVAGNEPPRPPPRAKSPAARKNKKKADFKEPVLSPEELRRRQIRKRRQFRVAFSQKIFYPMSKHLSSRTVQIVVAVAFVLLLWCSVQGVRRLENRMDYRKILPRDSASIRAFDLMNVNFVHNATTLPHAMSSRAHMSWLFDYYRNRLGLNYFADNNLTKTVNMTGFKDFISTFPYKAWQGGVHFVFRNSRDPKPTIERMVVLVAYNETRGLNGKLELMRNCRRVAAQYRQFGVVAFDTDSQTVDVIDAVPATTICVILCLTISTAILSVLILGHLLAALITVFDVCALLLVFYGMGQTLVGFELDFLAAPSAWTVAAQAVYIGCQYVGNYLQCWAKEDQQRRALEFTVSALWKTSLLWVLVAIPQCCGALAPLFAVQARLQLLAALATLAFALLFQPTHVGFVEKCVGARVFQ